MTQSGNFFLCNGHCVTDGAVLTLSQTGFGTSGSLSCVNHFGVTQSVLQLSTTHGTSLCSGTSSVCASGVAGSGNLYILVHQAAVDSILTCLRLQTGLSTSRCLSDNFIKLVVTFSLDPNAISISISTGSNSGIHISTVSILQFEGGNINTIIGDRCIILFSLIGNSLCTDFTNYNDTIAIGNNIGCGCSSICRTIQNSRAINLDQSVLATAFNTVTAGNIRQTLILTAIVVYIRTPIVLRIDIYTIGRAEITDSSLTYIQLRTGLESNILVQINVATIHINRQIAIDGELIVCRFNSVCAQTD